MGASPSYAFPDKHRLDLTFEMITAKVAHPLGYRSTECQAPLHLPLYWRGWGEAFLPLDDAKVIWVFAPLYYPDLFSSHFRNFLHISIPAASCGAITTQPAEILKLNAMSTDEKAKL